MKKLLPVYLFLLSSLIFSQNKNIDSVLIKETIAKAKSIRATDIDSSKIILKNANEDSKSIGFVKGEYMSLLELGISSFYKGAYNESIEYYEEALKIAETINFDEGIGRCYLNIAIALTLKGDYHKSTVEYLNSLKYTEKVKDTKSTITSYQNLGLIYLDLEQFDKSEMYSKKALDLSKHIGDSLTIGSNSINLIELYLNTKQYDRAYEELKSMEPLVKKFDNERLTAYHNLKLAEYYFSTENLDSAIKFAYKANAQSKDLLAHHDRGYIKWVLGNLNSKLEKFKLAEGFYLESHEIAKVTESLPLMVNTTSGLAELYANQKKYKKAYEFSKNHNILNDSIRGEKNSKLITEVTAKYETEKKDKELAEQNLQIEKQESELQKKKSQYTIMTGLAAFLLLISVLTWFLYQQRQKRKNQEIVTLKREQQVKTLESLMEGEEKERMRIAKELHDGVNVDLSAIKYKLTSLLEKNNEVINEAVAMIDKSCEQVRAISHNLIPPALKDFSLVEALQDYCSTSNTIHASEVSFQHIGDPISISKKAEVTIFRIVQELVNNSLKHAEASEVNVQISNRAGSIQITVEDNGKGFKKDEVASNGIGLKNIQSRIEYLDAKLDFNSGKDGTSYIIEINTETLI